MDVFKEKRIGNLIMEGGAGSSVEFCLVAEAKKDGMSCHPVGQIKDRRDHMLQSGPHAPH